MENEKIETMKSKDGETTFHFVQSVREQASEALGFDIADFVMASFEKNQIRSNELKGE